MIHLTTQCNYINQLAAGTGKKITSNTERDIDPFFKQTTDKKMNDELIIKNKWHKAKQKKASQRVKETNVEICYQNHYTFSTRLELSLKV